MKRNLILQAALAAAFSLAASSASAAVALSTTTASTPALFATELVKDAVTIQNAGNALDLTFKPTWGVAAGNHLYIRIDLTNGKFKTALTAANLTKTVNTAVTKSLSAGGATGDTFAIFDVSDTGGVQLADTVTLAPVDLTWVSAASGISAKVSFYTDASAASNATSATVGTTLSDAYTSTKPVLLTTYTPATSTASVAASFKKFGANKYTTLGTFSIALNSGTILKLDGTAAAVTDAASAATLVATGQFSSVGAGKISFGADCSNGLATAGTLNTGKTTATFTGIGNPARAVTNICFEGDGVAAIPAQTVSGVTSFTAAPGATAPDATGTVGTIIRDGAETFALNITAPGNADSTFVRISNVGTDHGLVKGTLYSEAGAVLGSGTLIADMLAGSTTVFSSDAIATAMGVTTWTGRAKMQIIGEVNAKSLRVQNLIRSGGILTNMGADTSTGNN